MSSWNNLPLELLKEILTLLHNRHYQSLFQCQLTCRKWSEPARNLIYSTIRLNTPRQAELFVRTVSATSPNKNIWSVSLHRSITDSPFLEVIFPRLFESCRYVTSLLASADTSFWVKLLREYYKGNINHLRRIPFNQHDTDDITKIYGYVACALQNSLSEISICDWPIDNPSFKNDQLAQQLPKFRNLKSLTVYLGGDKNIFEIGSLIQDCHQLHTLKIQTHNERKARFFQDSGDDIEAADELCRLPNRHPNIKRLELKRVNVSFRLIRYLMHLFPKVEHFTLNYTEEFDYDDNSEDDEKVSLMHQIQKEGHKISTDLWMEFLLHVFNNTSSFTLSALFFPDLGDVLARFIEATKFSDALEFIYVRRHAYIDIEPYVGLSSNNVRKDYSCGNIKVVYRIKEDDENLPHNALLDRIGSNLKRLWICIHPGGSFAEDDVELYDIANGYFLDGIFKRCPLLKTLRIHGAHLSRCDPEMQVNYSIELLRLFCSMICPGVLKELSMRLPNLAFLPILDSYFVTPMGHILENNKSITFDLSFSSINTLLWRNHETTYNGCSEFYLKLSKGNETSYFTGDKPNQQVTKSSARSYNKSLKSNTSLSIHIQCKDIQNFVLYSYDFDILFQFGADFKYSKGKTFRRNIKEIQ